MPEDPDNKTPLPEGSKNPIISGSPSDAMELDLWDLDGADDTISEFSQPNRREVRSIDIIPRDIKPQETDEEQEEAVAEPESPSEPEKRPRPSSNQVLIRPTDTFDELEETSDMITPPSPAETGEKGPAAGGKKVAHADESDSEDFDEDETSESDASDAVSTHSSKRRLFKIAYNKKDLIGLGAFGLILLVALIWALVSSLSNLRFQKAPDLKVRVPIEGSLLTISKADPYWREPRRSGPDIDLAKREAIIIPAIEITLSEKSTTGVLRLLFRDSDDQTIGDPVIKSFTNGKFASGATSEFAASDGFTDQSQFPAYRNERDQIWKAEVYESNSASADAQQFKKIGEIPLLPYLK